VTPRDGITRACAQYSAAKNRPFSHNYIFVLFYGGFDDAISEVSLQFRMVRDFHYEETIIIDNNVFRTAILPEKQMYFYDTCSSEVGDCSGTTQTVFRMHKLWIRIVNGCGYTHRWGRNSLY